MVVNDNGFDVTPISYTPTSGHITEGAVVGIAIGWIIGIIGFYILGMCLIGNFVRNSED